MPRKSSGSRAQWQISLGNSLRAARIASKLDQTEVAASLSVTREMIRLYENGKIPPPIDKLRELLLLYKPEPLIFDGITISLEDFPPRPSSPAAEQSSFAFDCSYADARVRVRAEPGRLTLIAEETRSA
jgi:transcriptional regulator with XRE-family HTH domain